MAIKLSIFVTVPKSRVKDKEGIEERKTSLKMLIFPSCCQFGYKFCVRHEEDDALLINTNVKCNPGTRMDP
jgi:hypothetical protein